MADHIPSNNIPNEHNESNTTNALAPPQAPSHLFHTQVTINPDEIETLSERLQHHVPTSPTSDDVQPPSYEEANDPDAPPPSYESLFGRVREVRKTSRGFFDYLKNLFFFLLGKIGLMIVVGVTIAIPVGMLVIGSIYVQDCPAEDYIPVHLIVGGAFGLLKQFLNFRIQSRRARQADLEVPDSSLTASLQSLINSFLICWFITGCYWVYHVYEPDYEDVNSPDYCNYVLFSFAFWLLTSAYIFTGVVILLLCCISSTALVLTGRYNR